MPGGANGSSLQRVLQEKERGFCFSGRSNPTPRSNVKRTITDLLSFQRNRNGLGVAPLKVKEAKPASNVKVDMVLGADD